jgi:glycosyltransferase involved in cell wall biosynthesis
MKIGYDHQIFSGQTYGGISRYFVELISHLKTHADIEISLPILVSNNDHLNHADICSSYLKLPTRIFRSKSGLFKRINDLYAALSKEDHLDLFHPTYYDDRFLDYIGKIPFVITIHDMIHEQFPELFPKKDKTCFTKKKLARMASRIIAVSEKTKEDIVKLLNIDENKIHVIHHGYRKAEQVIPKAVNLPENYILYVGSRFGYKNFLNVLKAFVLVKNKIPELELVCFGGGKFNASEIGHMRRLGIFKGISRIVGRDDLLAHCYRDAALFVFPSYYEGFGMPILEAFANRCPLVCSNVRPFTEIAQKAAEYFDPFSVDAICHAILRVYGSDSLKREMVAKGLKRLIGFDWSVTAQKTREVYEHAV